MFICEVGKVDLSPARPWIVCCGNDVGWIVKESLDRKIIVNGGWETRKNDIDRSFAKTLHLLRKNILRADLNGDIWVHPLHSRDDAWDNREQLRFIAGDPDLPMR